MANDEGVLLKVTQHFVQKGIIVLAFWFGRRQVQRLTSKKPGALKPHWTADATLLAAGCKHFQPQEHCVRATEWFGIATEEPSSKQASFSNLRNPKREFKPANPLCAPSILPPHL